MFTIPPLNLDSDMVLRGQGADPAAVAARRPALVELARKAIAVGTPLLRPVMLGRVVDVVKVSHNRLVLEDGRIFEGGMIARHLAPASSVAVLAATIGAGVEEHSTALMGSDPALALALDGFANAAVELLCAAACCQVVELAQARGMQTGIPIGPGVEGWPVDHGQPEVFAILQPDPQVLRLTPSALMLPRKSATLVIGMGVEMPVDGDACQYCSSNQTCRYRQAGLHGQAA